MGTFGWILAPIWAFTVPSFGGPGLAVDTARGLWVALYYWSLMLVLAWPARSRTGGWPGMAVWRKGSALVGPLAVQSWPAAKTRT